ncbi:hypothetical protein EIN_306170 [Entamoeba invadens IP1]|uniref:Deoxynucleoside kinase domain-containing protein n=1 Tax=Entamoeba invadens IP1 TaxID=370355 RepID=A0A0A1U4P2_ENTIV|nr:hypothetical protein EIN_306170 [Entamoeba invadens IP1]ELP86711.1 hypothetical protein EIN_306170 [Entamoeba invadens IP1]|eukprot:XP_004186057.1 hypothetical protein EIN_306170 [Entamoeba invadens IP1]
MVKEFIDYSPVKGKAYLEGEPEREAFANTKSIVVMERGPFDSVGIFTRQSLREGRITQEGYDLLMQKVREMELQYGIPSSTNLHIEQRDMALMSAQNVYDSLKASIYKTVENKGDLLIYLYSSNPQKQLQNIEKRGREGEKNYNVDYLLKINQAYSDLFANRN